MGSLRPQNPIHSLIHLASAGTVLTDLASIPRMLAVSVSGLLNTIDALKPHRVIVTSSCAVYGNSSPEGSPPTWKSVRPVGIYGMSKAIAERAVEQWARTTGSPGIILRMGNVVGSGGAGLIGYLVRHAVKHPDGAVPAGMRGGGRIIRDYVPVDYVVKIVERVLAKDPVRDTTIYNVGSGRTMSNGEVADIVKGWLARQGYALNIAFQDEPAPGEAIHSALETGVTEKVLGLRPPTEQDVHEAIVAAASSCLSKTMSEDRFIPANR